MRGVPLGAEAVGGILSQPKEVVVEAPSRENHYRDHEIVCFKNLPVAGYRKPSKDSPTMYVLLSILPLQTLSRGHARVTHSCYMGEGGEQETRRQRHSHPFLRGRWEEGEAQPQMSKLAFKTYPVHLTLESVSSRSDLFSLEQTLRCLWGVTKPPWLPPPPQATQAQLLQPHLA